MFAKKLLLGFFLCLLGTAVIATTRAPRLGNGPEYCNLERLRASQPSQILEFEGGMIEKWAINDNQFECVGTSLLRKRLRPQGLSLPSYHPTPRLVFVVEGEGILGVNFPGCAETYDTGVLQQQQQEDQQELPRRMGEQGGRQITRDSHQKVHRMQPGFVYVIPAGAIHWAYNDRDQDLIAIAIDDVNNPSNQLDMLPRDFWLAGGVSSQHIHGEQQRGKNPGRREQKEEDNLIVRNIFAGFDISLLAEALNTDPEIIRSIQESSKRGAVVIADQPMQFITPDEQEEGQPRQQDRSGSGSGNGLEETSICSATLHYHLDNENEADIISRQAGKLNAVNENKLPILSVVDVSAEKGYLVPNGLFSPHWSINSHTTYYVLNGDARVQIVSNNGETVLDGNVRSGRMFVVPQFFAFTARAGDNGFEWVSFKTNRSPMRSPLAGYTSVFRALPLEVITNSYDVSPSQAQSLKTNRETESILLSPQRTSQRDN